MTDYERARKQMVENQLRTNSVVDRRLLAQMGQVPRELFVPPERQPVAYIDDIQPLGENSQRFLSMPLTFARMAQLADVQRGDAVLDIGCATGYSAAVLAGLAASVVGLEEDEGLAQSAAATLGELGITNAEILAGGPEQLSGRDFDVIIVEGTLDAAPQNLYPLLRDHGRMVALIRDRGVAVAHLFVRTGSNVAARAEFNAHLPPLWLAKPEENFVF
ncbi:protein-L-isoaspartate O-methyltransferase [Devosia sp. 1566]|uniref:protein-L-isoaspartate O-methyltransferase family protein n=1 Tax=Devosia sp. 1566 TaxID=2499144 RepID=UPI000FDAB7FF|nr:protein-L-isoaspartate O-methyltransferase [Devosia sp. 1566]